MVTSQDLMTRYNIAKSYQLSRKLEPLKKHLGVDSFYTQTQIDGKKQWSVKPEFESVVTKFLESGELPTVEESAIVLSPSKIQTLDSDKESTLDILEAELLEPEVELNGSLDSNVDKLQDLTKVYKLIKARNDSESTKLSERKNQVKKTQKLIKLLKTKIAEELERGEDIESDKRQLKKLEESLSKQLEELDVEDLLQ